MPDNFDRRRCDNCPPCRCEHERREDRRGERREDRRDERREDKRDDRRGRY